MDPILILKLFRVVSIGQDFAQGLIFGFVRSLGPLLSCYILRFCPSLLWKHVCRIVSLNFWECVKTIKQQYEKYWKHWIKNCVLTDLVGHFKIDSMMIIINVEGHLIMFMISHKYWRCCTCTTCTSQTNDPENYKKFKIGWHLPLN